MLSPEEAAAVRCDARLALLRVSSGELFQPTASLRQGLTLVLF
jgi:hypothetical protein